MPSKESFRSGISLTGSSPPKRAPFGSLKATSAVIQPEPSSAGSSSNQAHRNIARLRYREFFDLHKNFFRPEPDHDQIGHVGDEPFQQFPTSPFTKLQELLRDVRVVDRLLDAIADCSRREIVLHLD